MTYSISFFEVSAQLIPVLFLATVVEEKLRPAEEETPFERVARSWLLVSLIGGELLSLAVVAGGVTPSKGVGGIVASAMLFATFIIALPVIGRELQSGRSHAERLGHGVAGIAVIGTVLMTIVWVQFA